MGAAQVRRLLVNDALSQLGEITFWHRLQEWTGAKFIGGDYQLLPDAVDAEIAGISGETGASLIIRNATYFPPIRSSGHVPTISLLQDIVAEGPVREMQQQVLCGSDVVVFNSAFTADKYVIETPQRVIPLPVDFSVFTPQNALACQQALSLPDGCVCWIGASQGAAGHVKGFDIFLSIVRQNPDLSFVGVFKDAAPETLPPNLRAYVRLTHDELVKVIGACRVGLCTSRSESQHLAGIEMGACGLPMVAPPVGIYWNGNISGTEVSDPTIPNYTTAIRAQLAMSPNLVHEHAREFWQRRCDIPVVRAAWAKLIEEVECSGQS